MLIRRGTQGACGEAKGTRLLRPRIFLFVILWSQKSCRVYLKRVFCACAAVAKEFERRAYYNPVFNIMCSERESESESKRSPRKYEISKLTEKNGFFWLLCFFGFVFFSFFFGFIIGR